MTTTLQGDACCMANCLESGFRLYGGMPYCGKHYRDAFLNDFASEYHNWDVDSDPRPRFRRLLGRVYEELGNATGDSYLSAARIRDRGFAFQKSQPGGSFCITRHKHAWSDSKRMERNVQCWRFNVETFEFDLAETRAWAAGDPE